MTLRIFPVASGASYTDDFNAGDRPGRTHLGNDLFSREGQPLLAVDDGTIRYGEDGLGGHVANLYAQDNTRYYYAHQSAFEGTNRMVKAGDVIGYMGHTGNAANTPTHLHFEVHPNNSGPSGAVDPYPFLRQAKIHNAAAPAATSKTSLLTGVLIVGTIAAVAWAYTEPATASSLLRKVGL